MQNEGRYETKIVDTNETLPFVLKLIIGNEGKGDYILLNRLCTSTTALVQCIYKVQELKPIRLQYLRKRKKEKIRRVSSRKNDYTNN